MMDYCLPTKVNIDGTDYEIRSDYRAVLDICTALSDYSLSDREKATAIIVIFYVDASAIPQEQYKKAIQECFKFIDGGQNRPHRKMPRLVNWEQDFQYIVAPINKASGMEIRAVDYMHWWTFLSFYNEIDGECTFAQIVSIRDKKARCQKLSKEEKEWYRRNKDIVDIKQTYSDQEMDFMNLFQPRKDDAT